MPRRSLLRPRLATNFTELFPAVDAVRPKLGRLLLWHDKGLDDEDAKVVAYVVATSGSMATLYLYQNQIGDVGAKAIAEAVKSSGSMVKLGLRYNSIGDAAKQSLRDAVRVRQGFDLSV